MKHFLRSPLGVKTSVISEVIMGEGYLRKLWELSEMLCLQIVMKQEHSVISPQRKARFATRNIKEIVKLKGSEDLWEVAKLHNRESSFPVVFIT
ncbi:hypothetical protein LOK49_LG13G01593 [Camellia lanceoleosa]|uniref:Uncharacterized protein n=1 Tax=Camellia lanceoleosa TaxID=1840588 RepID=A0ACC0FFN8_9ERIC|nr:hypothetical protein LOK49_LG13G01593 [Camellia lanceoleosa]